MKVPDEISIIELHARGARRHIYLFMKTDPKLIDSTAHSFSGQLRNTATTNGIAIASFNDRHQYG